MNITYKESANELTQRQKNVVSSLVSSFRMRDSKLRRNENAFFIITRMHNGSAHVVAGIEKKYTREIFADVIIGTRGGEEGLVKKNEPIQIIEKV